MLVLRVYFIENYSSQILYGELLPRVTGSSPIFETAKHLFIIPFHFIFFKGMALALGLAHLFDLGQQEFS